jgi:dTDP-4-dehydrorhamnose 3,5-epimerase
MESIIEGIFLTDLKIIPGDNGRVLHGIKANEDTYRGFGEAYFSSIVNGKIKGWKKHLRMTLNLIVPTGAIRFVIFDDRPDSRTYKLFNEFSLGPEIKYCRLTVSPGVWMAFQGLGGDLNLLLNIASIPHDPAEILQLPFENDLIPNYNW